MKRELRKTMAKCERILTTRERRSFRRQFVRLHRAVYAVASKQVGKEWGAALRDMSADFGIVGPDAPPPYMIEVDPAKPGWVGVTFARHSDGSIHGFRIMPPMPEAESVYPNAEMPPGLVTPQT